MVIYLLVRSALLDIYSEIIEIFKERKFIRAEITLPTYICSIGCHMFNFMNKHKQIYWEGDTIPDMRLHIFMVTIPGFGKTYTINQFMSKYNGLLHGSTIDVSKIGSLTSAGLVGSVKSTPDGQTIFHKGTLEKKANFILGSDEFSNITTSAKTSHSGNLINDLLSALDDGQMNKGQSGGDVDYETFATIWGATQPGRYELKSGLPRRFVFVIYMPDVGDVYKFRQSRRDAKNVKVDVKKILNFKVELEKRKEEIDTVLEGIVFTDEWYDYINQHFATHYEDILYERIALGYHLMKCETIPKIIRITLDDELKFILEQQFAARLQIARGVDKIKIMEVFKNVKSIKYTELLQLLLTFALPEKYILTSLDALKANKIIKIEDGIVFNMNYEADKRDLR